MPGYRIPDYGGQGVDLKIFSKISIGYKLFQIHMDKWHRPC